MNYNANEVEDIRNSESISHEQAVKLCEDWQEFCKVFLLGGKINLGRYKVHLPELDEQHDDD